MEHIPGNGVDRLDNEPAQVLPPTNPGIIMKQPLHEAVRREGPLLRAVRERSLCYQSNSLP
jgi:hypothetical protein